MIPLGVCVYVPKSVDRKEIHEWAELMKYYHHSYLDLRFDCETVRMVQCTACERRVLIKDVDASACTCGSCGYSYGRCVYCECVFEWKSDEVILKKKKNMIVVSVNKIVSRRGKHLQKNYNVIRPSLMNKT